MNKWVIYQRERFPLGPNILIAFGMGSQATVIAARSMDLVLIGVASLMMLAFFAVLRLMDEVKDVAKDRVAHPERPLARGLIDLDEARHVIVMGVAFMYGLAACVGCVFGAIPGLLYALTTTYLWLMYKEFFGGSWLSRWPLFYAATHQIVLLPLVASGAALAPHFASGVLEWPVIFLGGIQILPAFFAYEVSRKLVPDAHPILGTYRGVYGLRRCQLMLAGFFCLSLYGFTLTSQAFPYSALSKTLLGGLLGLFAGLPLATSLLKGDAGAKAAEGLATLNLIFTLYTPSLVYAYLQLTGAAP